MYYNGLETGCAWNSNTCAYAAMNGHIEILKWARSPLMVPRGQVCEWDSVVLWFALSHNHFEIFKWAIENGCEMDEDTICAVAAEYGRLEILKWLYEQSYELNEMTCAKAAGNNQLEILKWLRSKGCPWDDSTCNSAAIGGHLEVLEWVRLNGCTWDHITPVQVASGSHFETFKWITLNGGITTHPQVLIILAVNREYEMFKWAQARNYVWDPHVTNILARDKAYEMLNWAHENGCGYGDRVGTCLVKDKEYNLFKQVVQNGCVCSTDVCSTLAEDGNLEMLQWARQHGCPWDSTTCWAAAGQWHLDILKWARLNGCDWDSNVYMCGEGNPEIIDWAIKYGCPITDELIDDALKDGLVDLLRKLHSYKPIVIDIEKFMNIVSGAEISGETDVLEWVNEIGYQIDWELLYVLIIAYSIEKVSNSRQTSDSPNKIKMRILNQIKQAGWELTSELCTAAVVCQDLEVLQWATLKGCKWSGVTWYHAVSHSSPTMKRWIKADKSRVFEPNRHKRETDFCAAAALEGNLSMLKKAKEYGYQWDYRVALNASKNNHFQLLQWAVD